VGEKLLQPIFVLFFVGQNDCNLLHLTNKHIFEKFGGQLPGCFPLVAGLTVAVTGCIFFVM